MKKNCAVSALRAVQSSVEKEKPLENATANVIIYCTLPIIGNENVFVNVLLS
jgi:hypothetical protein